MRTIHFSRLIAVALSLTLLAGCGALILWDLLRARRMDAR